MSEQQELRDRLTDIWERLGYTYTTSVKLSSGKWGAAIPDQIYEAMLCVDKAVNLLEKDATHIQKYSAEGRRTANERG